MDTTTSPVREKLLSHAITLMMLRGYSGFSYRDLSALVGVKTSSIHYHFPSKDDLVLEAVGEYSSTVMASVYGIDPGLAANVKLDRYAKMVGKTLGDGEQICLCGMLAADLGSLPEKIGDAVQSFFKANEKWLSGVLAQGAEEGTLVVNGSADLAARVLFASFQGAILASRLFNTKARLDDVPRMYKVST